MSIKSMGLRIHRDMGTNCGMMCLFLQSPMGRAVQHPVADNAQFDLPLLPLLSRVLAGESCRVGEWVIA